MSTIVVFIGMVVAGPLQGQATIKKKYLQPKDYTLWHSIKNLKLSDDGMWYSYRLDYEQGEDTLFVAATQGDKRLVMASGYGGEFSPGGKWFASKGPQGRMELWDLKKDTHETMEGVRSFGFSPDGRHLLARTGPGPDGKGPGGLLLMDLGTGKRELVANVSAHSLSPDGGTLALATEMDGAHRLSLRGLRIGDRGRDIAQNRKNPYKKMVWDDAGRHLAFLERLPDDGAGYAKHIVHYRDTSDRDLSPRMLEVEGTGLSGLDITDYKFRISNDGDKVFLYVQDPKTYTMSLGNPDPDAVQIWRSTDLQIYPQREKERGHPYGYDLAVWMPDRGRAFALEGHDRYRGALTGDQGHFLRYDPVGLPTEDEKIHDADIEVLDLESGHRRTILKDQEMDNGFNSLSPGGRYMAYFREGDWWLYDLKKGDRHNLTGGLGTGFTDTQAWSSSAPGPYAPAVWDLDDKGLLLFDAHDIWRVDPRKKRPVRITEGRESDTRFRLAPTVGRVRDQKDWGRTLDGPVFDLSRGVVLEAVADDHAVSQWSWDGARPPEKIVEGKGRPSNVQKARDREAYLYIEEDFDRPPRVMYRGPGMGSPRMLVATNGQQSRYHWGRSELLEYTDGEGTPLKAALFHPADFDPGKKYPMVVYLYRTPSNRVHRYVNPSEHAGGGFNTANLTTQGYFVLMPDIHYIPDAPARAATQYTLAAVDAALDKGYVDPERIGLYGHSWGGYEAAVIATRTDRFATVVAGAGIHNLVSYAHHVGRDTGRSEMWRMEDQNMDLKGGYFDDKAVYLENSSFHNADRITCPLLLYTGEEDHWVDRHQSVELFLAMRKLGKQCELLVYPKDNHSIYLPRNQKDLTRRIMAWFDRYLKE